MSLLHLNDDNQVVRGLDGYDPIDKVRRVYNHTSGENLKNFIRLAKALPLMKA